MKWCNIQLYSSMKQLYSSLRRFSFAVTRSKSFLRTDSRGWLFPNVIERSQQTSSDESLHWFFDSIESLFAVSADLRLSNLLKIDLHCTWSKGGFSFLSLIYLLKVLFNEIVKVNSFSSFHSLLLCFHTFFASPHSEISSQVLQQALSKTRIISERWLQKIICWEPKK